MASQFQNRLVGVTILVALVIIFLPSIIDGKKTTYEDEFVSTPIKPKLKEHRQEINSEAMQATLNAKKEVALDEDNNKEQWKIEEIAQPLTISHNEPVKIKKTVKKIIPVSSSVEEAKVAWTIQLGAFQNAKNINALLKKLNKAGFQAHTMPRQVIDGQLTRIFVGPNVSKSVLTRKLSALKKLTHLQGKVMPFDAVNP
ncbi:hypothetical protein JI57_04020 [Psychromonas sp. PRT-SC03]|nr:hypothetical protein JI57_04020 [Psychromonas sp. PRT-SC03]